jgi:hypothetical protein
MTNVQALAPDRPVARKRDADATRAADAAPPDTLEGFLRSLSDSTDIYFGKTAAPLDTTGFDSALAVGLAKPPGPDRRRPRVAPEPFFTFNRADGAVYGAGLSIRRLPEALHIGGKLGWADGSRVLIGDGTIGASRFRDERTWTADLWAGRRSDFINRDANDRFYPMLEALVSGSDHQNYVRHDGYTLRFGVSADAWGAGIGFRDLLESPLATTTTWNISGGDPEPLVNLPAAFGRLRELGLRGTARWLKLPVWTEVTHQTSGRALGSDFDYRRTRVATAADLSLWRWLSVVPQAMYGRVRGDAIPQAAFYLGGSRSLRSLPSSALGGTGAAVARLDLIESPDVLALVHVPHPSILPIQLGAFAAVGAAWGPDPLGGPGSADADWPDRNAWLSEAGASILYRPGFPDGESFLRIEHAWPIGPDGREPRWSIAYNKPFSVFVRSPR